ncbi:glucose-induced degradation complex subunit GID8 [Rhodotorula paludigena]|uniref:glucose-induced degradation complex subunit GID8 n=1 Tax=Rhodotorula paludigena TaxID=86838 RepID=UPI00317F3BA3
MSSRRPVTSPEEWSKRLADVQCSKDDLNLLVANYLFTEGYLSAAENFARESGLSTSAVDASSAGAALGDVESIRARMDIRRAVLRGEVETALNQVIDLDLEILDLDPSLHFHLLQQHLIELIRAREIPLALAFAQNELAPLAEEHPRFLKELERTMALLAFELPTMSVGGADAAAPPSAAGDEPAAAAAAASTKKSKKDKKGASTSGGAKDDAAIPPMPLHISALLDPSQRLRTAQELNAAILHAQGHPAEPKLPKLMSVMNWGEGLLSEKGVEWPKWDLHELLQQPAASASPVGVSNGGSDAAMAL